MAKVVDLKPEPPQRTNLAAEVAPKLEAARARLAELESHVNAAALAATSMNQAPPTGSQISMTNSMSPAVT